jgi:hypothetical protein
MLTKFTRTTDISFVEFAQVLLRRGSEMYLCLLRTLIVLHACDVALACQTDVSLYEVEVGAVLCGFSVCSPWKVSMLLR